MTKEDRDVAVTSKTELLAEDHSDVVVLAIRNDDVGLAVAVEIAERDAIWSMTDGDGVARCKAAFAVAAKNREVVALRVTDRDIRIAVAIDIADRYARRPASGGERRTGNSAKTAFTIA